MEEAIRGLDLLQFEVIESGTKAYPKEYDLEQMIFELDGQIQLLSSQADNLDYLVAIGSGLICGIMDIFWVGDFDLKRGREISSQQVDEFVKKSAKLVGCESDNLHDCIKFLEGKFPIPSDGNTPDFGGALQHHLRDFAHHPTIVGLMVSILTQFTETSYGVNNEGAFIRVALEGSSVDYIGKTVLDKLIFGTLNWFFHLVSDMAGSSGSVGLVGAGVGIPGPILGLAKEMATLPMFKNKNAGDYNVHVFLSKLYNGTLFAQRDPAGKVINGSEIRFDLRGELGLGVELLRQSVPVIANECIVRSFYLIRRIAMQVKVKKIKALSELQSIQWKSVVPANNPTIARMLTISTGVFTSVDIAEAVATQKYWISINYLGVGRFTIAIAEDVGWALKARDVKVVKRMYEEIQLNVFRNVDNKIYERMGNDMNNEKFGLDLDQAIILYNIEYYKTLNDIFETKTPINNEAIKSLKRQWAVEWKEYITNAFPHFIQRDDAKMHWYTQEELIEKIMQLNPEKTWFRLVLLEAMLFEPYFALGLEKNKEGKDVPSKKYNDLHGVLNGYKKSAGDNFLEELFPETLQAKEFIKRIRKTYDKVLAELNEVLKLVLKTLSISAVVTIVAVATVGALAPQIAVALVGSNFSGLAGAALTNASLAFLGGGAIAAGGAGMAGGAAVIAGGGAMLGIGIGASAGGMVGVIGLMGKQQTILQTAKLLVAVKEIFLSEEADQYFIFSVYERFVNNIKDIEMELVDLKLRLIDTPKDEKKQLKNRINSLEETVEAMKIARKNLKRTISSFEEEVESIA